MDICAEGESAVLALGKQVPHTRPVTAILRKGFLNPGHASSDKGDLVAGLNGELLRHSLHQVLRVWTPESSAAQDANLQLVTKVAPESYDRIRGGLWFLRFHIGSHDLRYGDACLGNISLLANEHVPLRLLDPLRSLEGCLREVHQALARTARANERQDNCAASDSISRLLRNTRPSLHSDVEVSERAEDYLTII